MSETETNEATNTQESEAAQLEDERRSFPILAGELDKMSELAAKESACVSIYRQELEVERARVKQAEAEVQKLREAMARERSDDARFSSMDVAAYQSLPDKEKAEFREEYLTKQGLLTVDPYKGTLKRPPKS